MTAARRTNLNSPSQIDTGSLQERDEGEEESWRERREIRVGRCWLAARNYRNPSPTLHARSFAGFERESRWPPFPRIVAPPLSLSLSLSLSGSVREVPVYRIGVSPAEQTVRLPVLRSVCRLACAIALTKLPPQRWHDRMDSIRGCFRILVCVRGDSPRLLTT